MPGEIQAAAGVCWPVVLRLGFDPDCNSLMYGTGDWHWQNLLRRADELERQAQAARVCGEWLRTAPVPLTFDQRRVNED